MSKMFGKVNDIQENKYGYKFIIDTDEAYFCNSTDKEAGNLLGKLKGYIIEGDFIKTKSGYNVLQNIFWVGNIDDIEKYLKGEEQQPKTLIYDKNIFMNLETIVAKTLSPQVVNAVYDGQTNEIADQIRQLVEQFKEHNILLSSLVEEYVKEKRGDIYE